MILARLFVDHGRSVSSLPSIRQISQSAANGARFSYGGGSSAGATFKQFVLLFFTSF